MKDLTKEKFVDFLARCSQFENVYFKKERVEMDGKEVDRLHLIAVEGTHTIAMVGNFTGEEVYQLPDQEFKISPSKLLEFYRISKNKPRFELEKNTLTMIGDNIRLDYRLDEIVEKDKEITIPYDEGIELKITPQKFEEILKLKNAINGRKISISYNKNGCDFKIIGDNDLNSAVVHIDKNNPEEFTEEFLAIFFEPVKFVADKDTLFYLQKDYPATFKLIDSEYMVQYTVAGVKMGN